MSFLLADCKELNFGELVAVNGGCSGGMACSGEFASGGGKTALVLGCAGSTSSMQVIDSQKSSRAGTRTEELADMPKSWICGTPLFTMPQSAMVADCSGMIANKFAKENGLKNSGEWGNYLACEHSSGKPVVLTADSVYKNYYKNMASDCMNSVSKGYVFFDFDNNGTYDHMEYYESNGKGSYTCWESENNKFIGKQTYNWANDKNGKGNSFATAKFVRLQ